MNEIQAESFGFLVDHNAPAIGMMVNTSDGDSFIVPLDLETARDLGSLLLAHHSALSNVLAAAHA